MREVENTAGNASSGAIAITSAVSLCCTVKLASAESPTWIISSCSPAILLDVGRESEAIPPWQPFGYG
jgi:hypothetical protein